MNFPPPRFLTLIFLAAMILFASVGQSRAQQIQTPESATNAAAPPRQWKDGMLEKQLRGNVMKSFGFNSDSLNGTAVRPEISNHSPESGDQKHRREMLEQAKFFLMMNPNDSAVDATLDELVRLQKLNGDAQISKSPMESFLIEQLLQERAAATNGVKGGTGRDNESDSAKSFNPANQNRDSIQNNSLLRNPLDAGGRKSSGNGMFQSLLNPPDNPNQARLQQERSAQFRKMLEFGSSAGAQTSIGQSRSSSDFGRSPDSFSGQPNVAGYKLPAQPVASVRPAPISQPAYQPPPLKPPAVFNDDPPRRKF